MILTLQLMASIGLLIWLLADYIYIKAKSQEIKRHVKAEKQGIPRPHASDLQFGVKGCLGIASIASVLVLIETIRQGEPNLAPYFCGTVMVCLPLWALFAALNKASEEKKISEEKKRREREKRKAKKGMEVMKKNE